MMFESLQGPILPRHLHAKPTHPDIEFYFVELLHNPQGFCYLHRNDDEAHKEYVSSFLSDYVETMLKSCRGRSDREVWYKVSHYIPSTKSNSVLRHFNKIKQLSQNL